jgi:multiple sugar transport system permease protein
VASLSKRSDVKAIGLAALFLAPNIIGFIAFTLIPIVFSFGMAFTNWDLTLHNDFSEESIAFVGFENFVKLFQSPDFFQYLGNTFYLMLGIPFGIAGSLGVAILLNGKLHGPNGRHYRRILMSGISIAVALLLVSLGMGQSAFMTLLIGLIGLMLVGGAAGGTTVYRTLYYLPNFTQGVAIFILWKKLYNPTTGPINRTLEPVLDGFAGFVQMLPPVIGSNLLLLPLLAIVALGYFWFRSSRTKWNMGELGKGGLLVSALAFSGVGILLLQNVGVSGWSAMAVMIAFLAIFGGSIFLCVLKPRYSTDLFTGTGGHLLFSFFQITLITLGLLLLSAFIDLPAKTEAGIAPPAWIADYFWAKPSLIFMGLWASIGGNNMILYLAGLSNISPEYYEAADIDGADNWQKFRFITWPQLAPVTFFIVVMSVIYGLQGGFEMARTMTGVDPPGPPPP